MRSAIAQYAGKSEIDISVEERFVRFKFQADKVDIQQVLKALAGDYKRFEGRLVLQVENPKMSAQDFDSLRSAVKKVKGVRQLSSPDKDGLILVTFDDKEKTLLPDLLKAATDAGFPLADPKRKLPPKSL